MSFIFILVVYFLTLKVIIIEGSFYFQVKLSKINVKIIKVLCFLIEEFKSNNSLKISQLSEKSKEIHKL